MPAKKYRLDRYRKGALRPDFELVLNESDPSIVIGQPTVDEVLDLNEMTDPRAQLQVLAKDGYEALMAAIGGEPGGMINELMTDLLKHFGLAK